MKKTLYKFKGDYFHLYPYEKVNLNPHFKADILHFSSRGHIFVSFFTSNEFASLHMTMSLCSPGRIRLSLPLVSRLLEPFLCSLYSGIDCFSFVSFNFTLLLILAELRSLMMRTPLFLCMLRMLSLVLGHVSEESSAMLLMS